MTKYVDVDMVAKSLQKVCNNVERMIFQTGRNSPSTIYSNGNVSRSNFYDGKICIIVDIRVYSFVFLSCNM